MQDIQGDLTALFVVEFDHVWKAHCKNRNFLLRAFQIPSCQVGASSLGGTCRIFSTFIA